MFIPAVIQCHPGLGPISLSSNSYSWAARGGGGTGWESNPGLEINSHQVRIQPGTGHQQSSVLTTELCHTPFFLSSPLSPLTEVSPQPSAISTKRLADSCGLGRCQTRTWDCRTTVRRATTEPPCLLYMCAICCIWKAFINQSRNKRPNQEI